MFDQIQLFIYYNNSYGRSDFLKFSYEAYFFIKIVPNPYNFLLNFFNEGILNFHIVCQMLQPPTQKRYKCGCGQIFESHHKLCTKSLARVV